MTSLYTTFSAGFPRDRSRVLLRTPDGSSFSYADAESESARIACFLREQGLRPGDRVTVQAPKSPQLVWLYLACLRAGLVYHPLNDAYRSAELDYFLRDATPKLVVCVPEREAEYAQLTGQLDCRVLTIDAQGRGSLRDAYAGAEPRFAPVDCDDDTTAVLLYSSGTTGQPKGAMLTHGNLAANTATLVRYWGFTSDDRLLHALPIYHAHGLFVGLGCALLGGASMNFLGKFDTETVKHQLADSTVMMGIPTFYTRLLADPDFDQRACAGMRLFISGSAPLLADTHREFSRRTGHAILERYGMTETSMLSSNPLHGDRRPGSVGYPLPGVEIRIVDAHDCQVETGRVGEIQVRGPNVFKGYWNMPDKTAQDFTDDGFFRTGDQGVFAEDGYLTILGRNKDMIITGGLNVYPKEVELVLDELDGVVESAVIGVPHADFGEGVVAIIVPDASHETAESDIIATLRDRLAGFKLPKRVILVDELPRNAMGKVQKNELRQIYADTFS
ncbi:MAG: malonate--CoA ligase [Gammaproteobacteria bacterium]